jgi:RNA polymerase sigma-70 factor (ECF subfamily)
MPDDSGATVPHFALSVERDSSALSPGLVNELWHLTGAVDLGFHRAEFIASLEDVGSRTNFGLAPEQTASLAQKERFYRGLNLPDFALAQACALGHAAAWERFLQKYRLSLTKFAVDLTKSVSRGEDLADSLYSELFGLSESGGQRKSPLRSYSGRGALLVWLRAAIAQRHVAEYRRSRHTVPLEGDQMPAATSVPPPSPAVLSSLTASLERVLQSLDAEDRLLLGGYFLDQLTLLQVARLLGVHESTVSRQLKRLTSHLHLQLVKELQGSGMSARAAQEALGTDPRDLPINLRHLLQATADSAFPKKSDPPNPRQA